mgnify:CR=1 FL=1
MQDSVAQCLYNFVREPTIAAEIERLQLFEVAEVAHDVADAGRVSNGVVLERELEKFFAVLELGEKLSGDTMIDHSVLDHEPMLA